jgi:inosine-uridine nucleoside N-ribohydrolase
MKNHRKTRHLLILALALLLQLTAIAQKQKVIFDCDLGGDIDDAFAMALLLCSQEEIEILGITLDHGNTPGRAELACKILYETGMDHIPVYAGEHTPTIVGEQTTLEGLSTQMTWSHGFDRLLPRNEHAVDFMIRILNEYPDEVILFTVGPVDNIADMLEKDPDILKKAKKVVSMFGSIEVGYGGGKPAAEWNVRGSIEAGKRLMESGANITLAPLDITDHVVMEDDYLRAIAMRDTPLTDAIGSLYALWYRHADWAVTAKMFDGVAIGMVLWPELFTTREAYVYVDDEGFTRIDENKAPNCTIGVTINESVFIDRMALRILHQNFER